MSDEMDDEVGCRHGLTHGCADCGWDRACRERDAARAEIASLRTEVERLRQIEGTLRALLRVTDLPRPPGHEWLADDVLTALNEEPQS